MAAAYSGVAFRRVLAGGTVFLSPWPYTRRRGIVFRVRLATISGWFCGGILTRAQRRNTIAARSSRHFSISHAKIAIAPTAEQTAALGQLLEEQRDPGSANYHNWLTPEEYGERFGLSDADWEC